MQHDRLPRREDRAQFVSVEKLGELDINISGHCWDYKRRNESSQEGRSRAQAAIFSPAIFLRHCALSLRQKARDKKQVKPPNGVLGLSQSLLGASFRQIELKAVSLSVDGI